MKIKFSRLFSAAIILCTIIMLRYLLIFPQIYLGGYYWQRFVVALIGIAGMLVILVSKSAKSEYYHILKLYLIPYTIVIVINMLYTKRQYNYSINSIVFAVTPYLYPYLSMMIVYVMEKKSRFNKTFNILWAVVGLQVVLLILKTIGWFQYNFKESTLFHALVNEASEWVRNGLQRVYGGQLVGLAFVLLVYGMYSSRKIHMRMLSFLAAVYVLGFILVVTQGRFQLMAYTVTFLAMYFYSNRENIKKVQVFILLSIVGLLFLTSHYVNDLLSIFAITGSRGAGNAARLQTLAYYFKRLGEHHWLFGLGMLDTSNTAAYRLMEYNQWRLYYLDDIGIFGGIARFGLMSVVIYGWFIVLVVKTIKLTRVTKNSKYRLLSYGICTYLLVSNILLNIFEQASAFSVPFFLAIISYIYGDMMILNKKNLEDANDIGDSKL